MSFYFGIEDIASRCETANEGGEEDFNAVPRRSIFTSGCAHDTLRIFRHSLRSLTLEQSDRGVDLVQTLRDYTNSIRNNINPEMPSDAERSNQIYTEELRFSGARDWDIARSPTLHSSKMKKTDTSTCLENLAEGLYKTRTSCRDVVFRVQQSPPSMHGSLFGFPLHVNPSVSSTSLINMLNLPRRAEGMAACVTSNGNMCGSLMIMIHTSGRDIQHISSRRDEREVTIPQEAAGSLQTLQTQKNGRLQLRQVNRMLEITDIATLYVSE